MHASQAARSFVQKCKGILSALVGLQHVGCGDLELALGQDLILEADSRLMLAVRDRTRY